MREYAAMLVRLYDQGREALKELLQDAENCAKLSMRAFGKFPPTLFIAGEEGRAMFSPRQLTTPETKDEFAKTARLLCIAHGANAAVFAAEAWSATAKTKLDLTKSLSESPNREEIVMFMGESRDGAVRKLLPILRSKDGRFLGFDEALSFPGDQVQGRFAQFLPEDLPDKAAREHAKFLLELRGIRMAKGEERGQDRGMAMF